MRIKFKETGKQIELVQAMASKDRLKAAAAQESFAALMQPVVEKVILETDITSALFEDMPFREDEDPSIPLDPFRGYKEDTLSIWSQEVAGGLATNFVKLATDEFKFSTYRVDSAISWDEKFARKTRLPIIAGYMTLLAQELLRKRKINAWTTIFTGVANATHKIGTTATSHVFRAVTPGTFDMDEINYWFRLVRRLNQSVFGGSPTENPFGLTDLWMSPEFIQKIRAMSYNPINTKGANNVTGTAASGVLGLNEADRAKLLNTAGISSFMGVAIHELNEFGIGFDFNTLFAAASGATAYTDRAGNGSAQFAPSTEEVVLGVNGGQPFGYRPVETSDTLDNKSTFTLTNDTQFSNRSGKIGQYGWYNLAHILLSTRPLTAYII